MSQFERILRQARERRQVNSGNEVTQTGIGGINSNERNQRKNNGMRVKGKENMRQSKATWS